MTFSRARRGVPPSTSTAPATSILPTPLPPAGGTFIGEGLGLQKPGAAGAAAGADEPLRPTAREKVFRTCAFRRKAALEFDQRLGKPALGPRHGLTLLNPRQV